MLLLYITLSVTKDSSVCVSIQMCFKDSTGKRGKMGKGARTWIFLSAYSCTVAVS